MSTTIEFGERVLESNSLPVYRDLQVPFYKGFDKRTRPCGLNLGLPYY